MSNPSLIQVAHYCWTWPTGSNTTTGQIRRTVEVLMIVQKRKSLGRTAYIDILPHATKNLVELY